MRLASLLLIALATLGASAAAHAVPAGSRCLWVGPYDSTGDRAANQAFPDSAAHYWTARFAIPAGARLELEGRFPHARYMSLNAYDASTAAPVDTVRDVQLVPDRGSRNPFVAGARRDMPRRRFTVTVAGDAGAPARPEVLDAGVPGQTVQEVIYRVYVPDRGRGRAGGVALPSPRLRLPGGRVLRGRDACAALGSTRNRFEATRLPLDVYLALRDQPGRPAAFPAVDPPVFGTFYSVPYTIDCVYRGHCPRQATRVGGQYSNGDNDYIGAFVNRGLGDVLVLTGRMPRAPRTRDGERRMGRGQLRYWSLCQNESLATTAGGRCVYDEQVPTGPRGRYVIVTSRPEDRPRNAVRRCGVAFLPWPRRGDGAGHRDDALLLVRNLLPSPGFAHAVQRTRVPGDEARVMGPYLPQGRYTSTQAFERRGCERAPGARPR